MKTEQNRDWCAIDMEFYPSKKLSIGKGKPDLIVFDYKEEQLGIIELKYKNQNTDNIEKHLEDFGVIMKNAQIFNEEMERRIRWLVDFGLVDNFFEKFKTNNPVWYGFLFVDGEERKSRDICKKILGKRDGKIVHCCYVKNIEELNSNALCYSSMKTLDEFAGKI